MASRVEPELRVSVEDVCKSFGGGPALKSARLEVARGEVHALLGENGAGKSTLLNVLTGVLAADSGTLTLDGEPYFPRGPAVAARKGVHMVHQEAALCPHLSVAENLTLGRWPSLGGFVRRRLSRERAAEAILQVLGPGSGESVNLDAPAGSLPPSQRQLVAIARALQSPALKVLILDEPTASLAARDVAALFEAITRVKARGISVIYTSHFLEEVMQIADRFTVLKDGVTVATGAIDETTPADLVRMMAGRAVLERRPRGARELGPVVLELREVAGGKLPKGASLELHRGEILGIAGLLGSGRTELLRCAFGLDPVTQGSILLRGESGRASPARRWADGVGLLSEDRKLEGLSQGLSIAQNLALVAGSRLARAGFIHGAAERRAVDELIEQLGIVCQGREQPVSQLSGGNQQKVAFGRLLLSRAEVWLLDEPTRGVDVRSRNQIHEIITEAAGAGAAVLVVSSYLPELLALCDRVAVMRQGKLGKARPARELSEHALLAEAMGA